MSKYVVVRPSITKEDTPVYLSSVGYRDGGDNRRRNWVFDKAHATHYKTRAGAERAAARWDGAVEEYHPTPQDTVALEQMRRAN